MTPFSHQVQSHCPACNLARLGSELDDFERSALFSTMYTFGDSTAVTLFHILCTNCGIVYQVNPLTEESMGSYYSEYASHFGSATVSSSRIQLVDRQLDWLESVSDFQDFHTRTILDIGCGNGHFLDRCKTRWESTTSFRETNLRLISLLESKNHKRFLQSSQYSLVCCIQVLEHFVNPAEFLLDLSHNLSMSGLLFIEIPCHTFHDSSELGACFEHVTYFNSTGLLRLLDRTGYFPIAFEIGYDSYYCDGQSRIIRLLCRRKVEETSPTSEYIIEHFDTPETTINSLRRKIEELGLRQINVALYGIGEVARQLLHGVDSDTPIILIDSDSEKTSLDRRTITHSSQIDTLTLDIVIVTCNLPLEVVESLHNNGFNGPIHYWRDHESTLDPDDIVLNHRTGTL